MSLNQEEPHPPAQNCSGKLSGRCGRRSLGVIPSKASWVFPQVLSDAGASARDATWFPGGMVAAAEGQALAR